jgi:hypothetical protein
MHAEGRATNRSHGRHARVGQPPAIIAAEPCRGLVHGEGRDVNG